MCITPKLNHSVINKKQEDQMQFSPEKTFSKRLVIMQRRKSRATANEFITEKAQEVVSTTQIWLPIFCRNFQIFVVKFKFLRKLSDLSLLLGVTNITLALQFTHDFIFSTAKAANLKKIS